MTTDRLEIASRVLAGLLANPHVVQGDPRAGFYLANATEAELVDFAIGFADSLLTRNLKDAP